MVAQNGKNVSGTTEDVFVPAMRTRTIHGHSAPKCSSDVFCQSRKSFIFWEKSGAPGETRTPDPLVRSQMLYPAELRARGYMVYVQQSNAVSSAISTSSVSACASH